MAAKKQLEGVELANDIMLKGIYKFLLLKEFYGKENAITELKVRKDVLYKNGKLRKMLDNVGIKTHFDLALNITAKDLDNFGDFAPCLKKYRTQVIKKSFAHRAGECK